jgi:hypothetical protein
LPANTRKRTYPLHDNILNVLQRHEREHALLLRQAAELVEPPAIKPVHWHGHAQARRLAVSHERLAAAAETVARKLVQQDDARQQPLWAHITLVELASERGRHQPFETDHYLLV